MFLPDYLKDQFAKAEVMVDGNPQPLVLETKTLMQYPNSKDKSELPWPLIVFGALFAVVSGISVRAYLQKKQLNWLDYWLLTLSGLAGIIIGWFTLYSEHPAMSPNYNLLWAFPVNIFFAAVWAIKKWRPKSRYYFGLMGVLLLLSLVIGQTFNPAVYFIILILLVRAIVNVLPAK